MSSVRPLEKHPSILSAETLLNGFNGLEDKNLEELNDMLKNYNDTITKTIISQTQDEVVLFESLRRIEDINFQIFLKKGNLEELTKEKNELDRVVEEVNALVDRKDEIVSKSQKIKDLIKTAVFEQTKYEDKESKPKEPEIKLSIEEINKIMDDIEKRKKERTQIKQTPSTLEMQEKMAQIILPTGSFVLGSLGKTDKQLSRNGTEKLGEKVTPVPSRDNSFNYPHVKSSRIGGGSIVSDESIVNHLAQQRDRALKTKSTLNTANNPKITKNAPNVLERVDTKPLTRCPTKEMDATHVQPVQNQGRKSSLVLLKMVSNKLVRTKGDIRITEMFMERFRIIKEFTEYIRQYINWYNWLERDVYYYSIHNKMLTEQSAKELFSKYLETLPSDRIIAERFINLYGTIETTKIGNECDRFDELIFSLNKYLDEIPKIIECANLKKYTLSSLDDILDKFKEFKKLITKKDDSNCVEELVDIPEFHVDKIVKFVQNMIKLTPPALQTDELKECQTKIEKVESITQKTKIKLNDFNYVKEFGKQLLGFEELSGSSFAKSGRKIIQTYSIKAVCRKKVEKKLLVLCNDIILVCSKPNRNGWMSCLFAVPITHCDLILTQPLEQGTDKTKKFTKIEEDDDGVVKLLKKAKVKKIREVMNYCCMLEFVGKMFGNMFIKQQQLLFWGIPEQNSTAIKIALINLIASKKADALLGENKSY